MIKFAVIISVFLAVFFFCYTLFEFIANKIKENKNKPKIKYKELSPKAKTIIIAIGIFMVLSILLQNIIFGLIFSIIYLYFDWNIKHNKAKKRAALIDKQVIETLTLIKNAIQSGQSLPKAIEISYKELKEPIKSEMKKISDNLELGIQADDALDKASKNAPSKEFKLMIDTIKISKDSGSSLGNVFDRIIEATSQRVEIQSKVMALTAQGRMSGNIVSAIPFVIALMMYVMDPTMIAPLFTSFIGNILLLIVVIFILTGSFCIRKITEIDY